MSDHSLALVPLSSGYFQSPDLLFRKRSVDTGLFAESLIYYDRVFINVDNPHHFANFISLLIQQGLPYSRLLELIKEGTLNVYYYAFYTNPHVVPNSNGGITIQGLYNILDRSMEKPNSFGERFLEFDKLRECFSSAKQMDEFCTAIAGRVTEVKADEIGTEGIKNAWRDFYDPTRHELIAQQLVNEIYRVKNLGKKAPKIEVTIYPESRGGSRAVSWNVDLTELPALETEAKLKFAATLPLTGAESANKYIWSANKMKCDLYLPEPISVVVGDKLYEASKAAQVKTKDVINELELKVEFPNIHHLVNTDGLDFDEVLKFRKKAKKFRHWLQDEAGRDRDAIIAYHHEIAQETGFTKVGRRALRLFGVVGGATAGTAAGTIIGANPIAGAAMGAAAGEAVKYLFDIGADLGSEWKPVVFGNWYKEKISKLVNEDNQEI